MLEILIIPKRLRSLVPLRQTPNIKYIVLNSSFFFWHSFFPPIWKRTKVIYFDSTSTRSNSRGRWSYLKKSSEVIHHWRPGHNLWQMEIDQQMDRYELNSILWHGYKIIIKKNIYIHILSSSLSLAIFLCVSIFLYTFTKSSFPFSASVYLYFSNFLLHKHTHTHNT